MKRIVIINAKGGCGKTTISTNLASYYASQGTHVALHDYDPQGSSMRWLGQRPDENHKLHGVTANQSAARARGVTMSWHMRLPPETQRIIVDTPPGLKGPDLIAQLKDANIILVPVLPSSIDIYATADFVRDLLLDAKVRANRIQLAIIANRVRKNTLAFQGLERFLNSLNIPVLAKLRDTQNYVHAAEQGLGIHELKNKPVYMDREHWREIYRWIEKQADNKKAS